MQIGDLVIVREEYDDNYNIIDKVGEVICKDSRTICVQFFDYINGHDGVGGKDGYCWWVPKKICDIVDKKQSIRYYLERREDSS